MLKTGDFTDEEWESIFNELTKNPKLYGLPVRTDGSALIGSFNIRKLGNPDNRNANTWKFLVTVIKCFDILAIQEALDDISGLHRLLADLNGEYKMMCSDKTGTYPGDLGVGERLVFFYRTETVELGEVVSDITYDRSKVTDILMNHLDEIVEEKEKYDQKMADYNAGRRKTKPSFSVPTFLSFIRSPFCASFAIKGKDDASHKPYQFMAINAHLIFGTSSDRWREFEALVNWIRDRVVQQDKMYYPNYVLLGDLNLDYDNPGRDFAKMESLMKGIDVGTPDEIHVNFPFLDVHPNESEHFTSNVKLSQRYDQIGLFFRDTDGECVGFPTHAENKYMGKDDNGPDYGVFNFTELFAKAVEGMSFKDMSKVQGTAFVRRFEHEVSDHMPIWLRLSLTPTPTSTSVGAE
mmetsp:Transcript_28689/g.41867  ORF Transcript_28689/g.41867 Transcript_28689/m.41867 type:complete len:407 (-) Transcript_28689:42-1262(-)